MEPITFTAITGRKKKKSRMLLVTELINAGLEMDEKGCLGLSARSQFITSDYIQ